MSDVKSAAAQPVQFRGGGFTPGRRRWVPWITFVLIIGGWQLASSTHLLPPLFMPSPVEVALAMMDGVALRHVVKSSLYCTV